MFKGLSQSRGDFKQIKKPQSVLKWKALAAIPAGKQAPAAKRSDSRHIQHTSKSQFPLEMAIRKKP
ncbi:hypothetical protein [Rossellomorea marisflavi]|uniref:hypothetical protein n=1 Tax=Rossellomorea marisflavi TaxID=189381 RepID=UPI0035110D63